MRSVISFSDPRVESMKQVWDGKRIARKCPLSFKEAFECFASHLSISAIAPLLGVVPQRASQIYEEFFQPLFNESGEERAQRITRERAEEVQRMLREEYFRSEEMRLLVEQLPAPQYSVEIIPSCQSTNIVRNRLIVNGVLCSLHHVKKVYRPSKSNAEYGHFSITSSTLNEVAACILHCMIPSRQERIYIVPTSVILEQIGLESSGQNGTRSLYIPLAGEGYVPKGTPKIRYARYERAWHLLKKQRVLIAKPS